jgi:LPXTG-site transpeptidase (sortase) family protein
MRPKVIIYQAGKSKLYGQVFVNLPYGVRVFYHTMRILGISLVASAIVGVILAYGPVFREETRYAFTESSLENSPIAVPDVSANTFNEVQKETNTLGISATFSVVIPKIDAKSNVIANVDTTNKKEYLNALTNGVAHAKHTYFPGQGKEIFLFSHSTDTPLNIARYNAVFYLLGKLEKEDDVVIFFENKKYHYKVSETKTVFADDTSFLTDNYDEETLILMTCTPPGTTWKRLLIFAKLV